MPDRCGIQFFVGMMASTANPNGKRSPVSQLLEHCSLNNIIGSACFRAPRSLHLWSDENGDREE